LVRVACVVVCHVLKSQSEEREQVGQEAVSHLLIWNKSLAVCYLGGAVGCLASPQCRFVV